MSKRIVLTTFGSLGDLHPYVAIALELKQRGYSVAIATNEVYQKLVELEKIDFFPVRPDLPNINTEEAQAEIAQVMNAQKGTEYVLRQLFCLT